MVGFINEFYSPHACSPDSSHGYMHACIHVVEVHRWLSIRSFRTWLISQRRSSMDSCTTVRMAGGVELASSKYLQYMTCHVPKFPVSHSALNLHIHALRYASCVATRESILLSTERSARPHSHTPIAPKTHAFVSHSHSACCEPLAKEKGPSIHD